MYIVLTRKPLLGVGVVPFFFGCRCGYFVNAITSNPGNNFSKHGFLIMLVFARTLNDKCNSRVSNFFGILEELPMLPLWPVCLD